MRPLILLTVFLLAACGADGEPETPKAKSPGPGIGISITGTAEIGVRG